MTATYAPILSQTFANAGQGGARFGGGNRLFSYVGGSFSVLAQTWASSAADVPNTNPLVADANGRLGAIFLTPGDVYNFALTDPTGGTVLQTWVNVQGVIDAQFVQDEIAQSAGDWLPKTGGVVSGALTVQGGLVLNGNTTATAVSAGSVVVSGAITANGGVNLQNQQVTNLPAPIVGNNAATKAYVDGIVAALPAGVPSGVVMWTAGAAVPTGYLICAGTLVSRAVYPDLFTAIGTAFGAGDGLTTFNLPDLRGVFIRGLDLDRGLDPARAFGTQQADSLGSHQHDIPTDTTGGFNTPVNSLLGGDRAPNATGATALAGGSETRPVNVALVPIIKT